MEKTFRYSYIGGIGLLKVLRYAAIFGVALVLVSCSNNSVNRGNKTLPQEKEAIHHEAAFEEELDQYMSENFSGSVLLIKNNKVIIAKGYNMSDYANNLPNGPETIHHIGSLTKAFTAAAVLQLQEAGKLSVDDPVDTYIKDYPHHEVTLRHLLTHTSGTPEYTRLPGFLNDLNVKVSVDELIAKFKDLPLEFEPGSRFSYSNSGYVLLGAVIERVSGQSYSDYLRGHIFTPLGMKRSGYLTKDSIPTDVAVGYSLLTPEVSEIAQPIDMTVPYSAGGIYSTVEDLYKWLMGLENGTILSRASWEAMRTPELNKYALGWAIPGPMGTIYTHNGAINGFSSEIWRDMSKGTAVILLSNVEGDLGHLRDILLRMLDTMEDAGRE
ncbi:serine hydrolase domain-containing protein [Paenibacillus pedocola]|uniref:serine hydrolase domain-containing protein n=1 Tax=Paenibacillus pedocola TaxID=3242193 RepID=UPI002877757C|nr:serine hydrolase domain-containing protein [Paenibacillus typhae]